MITKTKITQNPETAQIVAGLLPNDPNIEFFSIQEGKKVDWLQHGAVHHFEDLSNKNYKVLQKYYLMDHGAQKYFHTIRESGNPLSFIRKVELYIYYMCGQLDGTPDLVEGILNFSENFRDTNNCPSLLFDKKFLTIDDVVLTSREIRMIDFMKEDLPDKAIASQLSNRNGSRGITQSTFDFHKKNLFHKIGVSTKTALLTKVFHAHI